MTPSLTQNGDMNPWDGGTSTARGAGAGPPRRPWLHLHPLGLRDSGNLGAA